MDLKEGFHTVVAARATKLNPTEELHIRAIVNRVHALTNYTYTKSEWSNMYIFLFKIDVHKKSKFHEDINDIARALATTNDDVIIREALREMLEILNKVLQVKQQL